MNLSLHLIKYLVYFRETCILTFLLGGINCSKSTRTMPSGEVGTYTFLNIIESIKIIGQSVLSLFSQFFCKSFNARRAFRNPHCSRTNYKFDIIYPILQVVKGDSFGDECLLHVKEMVMQREVDIEVTAECPVIIS